MVRTSQVDIPNPFNNNEYNPIFLLSTQESNLIKKDDLNKRLSEIEKNLDAVESLLNDSKSVIVDDEKNRDSRLSRSKSFTANRDPEDFRYKIVELKHRLSNQKSLSDIRSESESTGPGRLRHYRSTSIIGGRHGRPSRHASMDPCDFGRFSSGSNFDLLSLPGFKYEYTQKDQELKMNINAIRDRLIRKRISDTALSLRAYPSPSTSSLRASNNTRIPSGMDISQQRNKRLSIIEDSYEKLTGADNANAIQNPADLNQTDQSQTNKHNKEEKYPRRSLSYGYLRYSHYTNKSATAFSPTREAFSPQESTFSGNSSLARSNTSDYNANRKVLHMVKSIESMNGNINSSLYASPMFANSKLVDKEKLAKLAELRQLSEKRVEMLRRRLTADSVVAERSLQDIDTSENRLPAAQKDSESTDAELVKEQSDVKNKIESLKQQVSKRKSSRVSKTHSQILDPSYNSDIPGKTGGSSLNISIKNPRTLSRTGQYLKEMAEKESRMAQQMDNISDGTNGEEPADSSKSSKTSDKVVGDVQENRFNDRKTSGGTFDNSDYNQNITTSTDYKSTDTSSPQNTIHNTATTATTTITNRTSASSNVRNSFGSFLGYSNVHDYASTKPDLETVSQNLTYRRSAFADPKTKHRKIVCSQDSDNGDLYEEEDENENEDFNGLHKHINDADAISNVESEFGMDATEEANYRSVESKILNERSMNDTRMSSTDEIFDLAPNEVLVFENNSPSATVNTNNLNRNMSVKGYKSHGKSHSISSNFSVKEKFSRLKGPAQFPKPKHSKSISHSDVDTISLNSGTATTIDNAKDQVKNKKPKKASTINAAFKNVSKDGPAARKSLDIQHKLSNKDSFSFASNGNKASKSRLRHKLSKKRSFNVLKQSIVESNYSSAVAASNDNRRRSVSTPQRAVRHNVHPKKQKSSFLQKLANLFRRKD